MFPQDEQRFAYELVHGQSLRLDADLRIFYTEPTDPRATSADAKAWISRGFVSPIAPHQQRADLDHFRRTVPDRVDAVLKEIAEYSQRSVESLLADPMVAQAFTDARWAKAWAPDVIYSFYAWGSTLAAHIVCRLLDLPHVLFLYHLHVDADDFVRRLLPLYVKTAEVVLVGEDSVADILVANHGKELRERLHCSKSPSWQGDIARQVAAGLARRTPSRRRSDLGPRASFVTSSSPPAEEQGVVQFIVGGPERTGTNMLLDMLMGHPQVVVAGELFNTRMIDEGRIETHLPPDIDRQQLIELRAKDPGACIRRIHESARLANAKAFGFKLLYFHACADNRVVDHLVAVPELRVIHLVREDDLARWASQVRAAQDDKWFASTLEEKPQKGAPIVLDVKETLMQLELNELAEERFRATFDGVATYETSYERLVADLDAGVKTVLEFLGVDRIGLEPQSFKTGRKDVRKEIANWDELAAAFADTRWRHLFDRT